MAQKEIVLNIKLDATDAIREGQALAVNTGEINDRKKELNKTLKEEQKILEQTKKAYSQGKVGVDELNAAQARYAKTAAEIRKELFLVDSALTGNSGKARELRNEVGGLTDAGLRFRDKMAQAFADAIGPTFAKLSDAVGSANREMANALKTFGAGSAEFKKAADGVQRLETNLAELKAAQNEATTALKTFGENSKEFSEANERLKALEASAAGLADEVAGKVEPKFEALNRQLREARREAQAAADQFGFVSEEFKAAAARADDLDDQIKRVNVAIGAIDAEGKVETFGKALGGVAGAFSIAQGAAALFGTENEQVEQALLKVQAALAIQQGISGLIEGAKAAKGLALTLGLVAPAAEGGALAVNGLKAALVTSGIGIAVVALGLLATKLMEVKSGSDAAAVSYGDLLNTVNKRFDLNQIKLQNELLKAQIALRKEQAKGAEASAIVVLSLQQKVANIQRDLAQSDQERAASLKQAFADLQELRRRALSADGQDIQDAKAFAELQQRLGLQTTATLTETYKAYTDAKFEFRNQEAQAENTALKAQEQALDVSLKNREKLQEDSDAKRIKSTEDRVQKEAQIDQGAIDREREKNRAIIAAQNEVTLEVERLLNERSDAQLTAQQREENQLRDSLFTQIQSLQEGSEQRLALEELLRSGLAAIRQKYALLEADEELQRKQALIQAEQELAQARIDAAATVVQAFSSLAEQGSDVAKALFLVEKAIAIANVIRQASVAVAAARAAAVAIPPLLPPGVPNPAKAVAEALAIAEIAKIKTQAGASIATIAAQTISGFAEGGYTGSGGKYEPAGIVHKGEYVLPQEVVRALGVGRLDALRSMFTDAAPGRGRYATGGLVTPMMPSASIFAADQAAALNTMQLQPVLPVETLRQVENRIAVREARSTL